MKKILLFLSVAGFISGASAQTINSSDLGNVGDTYELGTDNNPNVTIGAAGTGQTWNFTSLNTQEFDTLHFVDPATIPGGNAFTGANIAAVSNQGTFFLEKTNAILTNHGVFSTYAGMPVSVVYNPPQDLVLFPASLGTNFSGISNSNIKMYIGIDTNVFGCQVVVDSVWVKHTSNYSVNFDASGTLQLPTDTLAALRSHNIEYWVDSIFIYAPNAINCAFPPVNIPQGWSFADPSLTALAGFGQNPALDTTEIYNWYAPGEKFVVCAIDMDGTTQINARFKSTYAHYTVGIEEPYQVETTLYPNPASDFVRIASDEPLTGSTATVYDLNGRMVTSQLINDQGTIQVSGLSNGMFIYMIMDQQNKPISKGRFVVAH